MPLLVLYGIIVLAAPALLFFFYLQFDKFRRHVGEMEQRNALQAAAFTREIAELKKQIAAQQNAPTAEKPGEGEKPIEAQSPVPAASQSRLPIAPAMPKAVPPVVLPPAVVVPPRPTADVESKPDIAKPRSSVEHRKPVETEKLAEPKAPASVVIPPQAIEPKAPEVVAAAPPKPVVEHKPAAAAPAGPPSATSLPPSALPSARVVSSPAFQGLRMPGAGSREGQLKQRIKKISAIEETLGTNWLTKLGVTMLVIGLALLGIVELQAMGPAGRAALLFLIALVLLVGGIFLEKREKYQLLGKAGIGGGWALLFFTSYGICHVQAMHVLDSLLLDSVLMLGVAVAMAAHTLRYRSQFVTGLAFLLAYTTVALSFGEVHPLRAGAASQITVYGLLASVMLSIGLIAIVRKMGWYELEVFGILSTYLNHLYWLFRILGIEGAHGRAFPEYGASTALLFFYWLAFRVSHVIRHTKTDYEEHVSTTAAILNSALVLATLRFQSVHPELAYIALLIVGGLELGFGPAVRKRREAFVVLTAMGAALLLAAAPSHYAEGKEVTILWLVALEVFLITGVIVKEVVFRRIGLFTGLLVAGRLAIFDLRHAFWARTNANEVLFTEGILFGLCAIVFYANVFGFKTRNRELFHKRLDDGLLTAHSYIGAVSAGAGAWALFTQDWTAVAFAGVMLALAAFSRGFPSNHLQVQYTAIGLATLFRATTVNLHAEWGHEIHYPLRTLTLPVIAAAFYLTAKLAPMRDDAEQRAVRGIFAACGGAVLALLIWYEAPDLWRPVAFIVFAVALSEAARAFWYPLLAWHAHAMSAAAVFTALTADEIGLSVWHRLALRDFSATAVVTGLYWIAWRPGTEHVQHRRLATACYTWAAAGLGMWMLGDLLPNDWVGVAWVVFAVVLALRRKKYEQLAWQANFAGLASVVWALIYNYDSHAPLWNLLNLRVLTISLIAAGLYFLARTAAPAERWKVAVAYMHSFAATGLLALLASYEQPNGWLAPLWATFALVLALVDFWRKCDELRWQAHALSLLALGRCVVFNLHLVASWHGLSVRLLSLTLVAVIFYALSRIVRMPGEWREREMHHIYSWAASALVGLMLWFELTPLGIAVGWGMFGLVLFEYGLMRKVVQFRYQAYMALAASFVRIFFANLNAVGEPGEFGGPRMYTVLPLTLIFFFVYAQLPEGGSSKEKEEGTERDHRLRFDALVGCLGTASVAALFYFQFSPEWVVTSWAAVGLVLFAMAMWLDRAIFLYQGVLMTLLIVERGLAHNLYGSGYRHEHDWQGRYVVLSTAAALLLASLAFAFPLRERHCVQSEQRRWRQVLHLLVARPEQVQFFAAILLLTLMLALKLDAGWVTVAWGVEGVAVILLALTVGERSFRLTGLGLLLLCVGKVVAMDAWRLEPRDRYITFIIVGTALLVVSYLYTRYREAIRQFL
jgi:uncharacterized membrane protein